MSCLDAARRIGKTGAAEPARAVGRPIAWGDVLAVVSDDETRSRALEGYRQAGHTPDAFAHRRRAREAMAEALTGLEDWLEAEHPRRERERAALRDIRRRLEVELWP